MRPAVDFSLMSFAILSGNFFAHTLLQKSNQSKLGRAHKCVMLILVTMLGQTIRNRTAYDVHCIACLVIVTAGAVFRCVLCQVSSDIRHGAGLTEAHHFLS